MGHPTATSRRRVLPISAKQSVFLGSTLPITGYVAGRGAGKTWVGGYRITSRSQPGDPWLCVSPDAGVVYDTTLPTFLEITQRLDCYRSHVLSPYPRVWWQVPGRPGSELCQIVFRSGEKPDKLRGPNKAGLWIDEASIQVEDVYRIARATLRYRGKMGPTLLTLTPRGRAHWTFSVFYEPITAAEMEAADAAAAEAGSLPDYEVIQGMPYRRRAGRELIQATTRDNPFLPAEFYDEMRGDMSGLLAEQELEGRFLEIVGLMFAREWFPIVDAAPRIAQRVRYWDRAASVLEDASYTAGVLIARDDQGRFFIEDVIHQTAVSDAKLYGGEVLIYAEQEGGSGGKEVMDQLIKKLAGFPVYRDLASRSGMRSVGGVKLPGGPKITRAQPLAAQAEAGNVAMVAGRWNQDFLSELCAFPESSHCDQVDAASAGLNRLARLAQPGEIVATKTAVSVDSQRFGQTMANAPGSGRKGQRRKKLFGR